VAPNHISRGLYHIRAWCFGWSTPFWCFQSRNPLGSATVL